MENRKSGTPTVSLFSAGTQIDPSFSLGATTGELNTGSMGEENIVKVECVPLSFTSVSEQISSSIYDVLPPPASFDNSSNNNKNSSIVQTSDARTYATCITSDNLKNQGYSYLALSSETVSSSTFSLDNTMSSSCDDGNSLSVQSCGTTIVPSSNSGELISPHQLNDSFSSHGGSSQLKNQEYSSYTTFSCSMPEAISGSQSYASPPTFMSPELAAIDATRPNLINEYSTYDNATSSNASQQSNVVSQIPSSIVQPFYTASTNSTCGMRDAYTESHQSIINNNNFVNYNIIPSGHAQALPSSVAIGNSAYQGGNEYRRECQNYDRQQPQNCNSYTTSSSQPSTSIMSSKLAEFRNSLQSLSLNKDVLMPRPDGSFYPYWRSLAINYQGIAESIVQSIYHCEYPRGIVSVMAEQLSYLRRKLQEFPEMAENEKDKFRRLYVLAALGMIAKLKLITFCWTYVELKENERRSENIGGKIDNNYGLQNNEMMGGRNIEVDERGEISNQNENIQSYD